MIRIVLRKWDVFALCSSVRIFTKPGRVPYGLGSTLVWKEGEVLWYRKGYVFLEGVRKREHKWDHASADLQLRESSSGRESWFPVIAFVREITLFPGCRPEPSSCLPGRALILGLQHHALSCVLQYALLFPLHLLENTLQ